MISIIGSGKVGSAIAFLCGSSGLDDITLVNRTEKKAIGEAMDISNSIPQDSSISIRGTSDYSKISGSEVLVIAASVGEHFASRTDKMLDQALMIRKITHDVARFAPNSKVLVVTNPVDILTFLIQKYGNLKPNNVIGVASSLDSSRFRYLLAQKFDTAQSRISDALVMGEHDDSMVPIFSQAKFDGRHISDLLSEQQKSEISSNVRSYWKGLRETKGQSVFGIAKNTFDIIFAIIKNQTLDVVASTLLDGQYGLSDVCVGVPITINKTGIVRIREISITSSEKTQLHKSADMVKSNIKKAAEFLRSSL